MQLIIDFYKELDTLNLIIFWGIIIVIILLLIFAFVMINKNKKLKKLVESSNNKYEEEIPIKKEENIINNNIIKENIEKTNETDITETINSQKEEIASIEKSLKESNTEPKNDIEKQEVKKINTIEIPSGPYQRNVLREMSLSQTSPIGINRKEPNDIKKTELMKDLETSLNVEKTDSIWNEEEICLPEIKNTDIKVINEPVVQINNEPIIEKEEVLLEILDEVDEQEESYEKVESNDLRNEDKSTTIINNIAKIHESKPSNNQSEKYLEEVSKKLAEAEIPDQIERTNYELKQEEDAIISYKELMEKKDSIQTVDEEDAIISIEELFNRNNEQQEKNTEIEKDVKLYNLTDTEENDDFINELKQFRNDL